MQPRLYSTLRPREATYYWQGLDYVPATDWQPGTAAASAGFNFHFRFEAQDAWFSLAQKEEVSFFLVVRGVYTEKKKSVPDVFA